MFIALPYKKKSLTSSMRQKDQAVKAEGFLSWYRQFFNQSAPMPQPLKVSKTTFYCSVIIFISNIIKVLSEYTSQFTPK